MFAPQSSQTVIINFFHSFFFIKKAFFFSLLSLFKILIIHCIALYITIKNSSFVTFISYRMGLLVV